MKGTLRGDLNHNTTLSSSVAFVHMGPENITMGCHNYCILNMCLIMYETCSIFMLTTISHRFHPFPCHEENNVTMWDLLLLSNLVILMQYQTTTLILDSTFTEIKFVLIPYYFLHMFQLTTCDHTLLNMELFLNMKRGMDGLHTPSLNI